ncbi:MAG: bifunctional metallophosphatase/5'-nucleotidase [Microscillaceae bacterium]|jgi:5'-nucleotidase|nr:bifunctional metallophosphatase/5'-nucleotidase [Microscillaceae bacterium]
MDYQLNSIFRKTIFQTLFFQLFWGLWAQGQVQEIIFLQLNDTYEIAPLANGKVGGMARVATVYQQLKAQNPHTYMIHAGDFLNPSVIGTLRYENQDIKGRQMIEVMNQMGMQYVGLGNHEFDLKPAELQARLNESSFVWIGSNVRQKADNQAFAKIKNGTREPLPTYQILRIGQLRVGLLGLILPIEQRAYVQTQDAVQTAQNLCQQLADSTDFILAITHQSIAEDRQLAQAIPAIRLIMGGHEHEAHAETVKQTLIRKADANAKTVYIHYLQYDTQTQNLTIRSELKTIDDHIAEDPQTAQVVTKWLKIAENSLRQQGFEPSEEVMNTNVPLDGLEATVRNDTSNLTKLLAAAVFSAYPTAQAAIYNSGSIRIDDKVVGRLTQYDILRILPFGGGIWLVEMKGNLLQKILTVGSKNQGTGGFLHTQNLTYGAAKSQWQFKNQKIKAKKYYRIAINEFLLSGKEANLDFLNEKNPDLKVLHKPAPDNLQDTRADIRKVFLEYLKSRK